MHCDKERNRGRERHGERERERERENVESKRIIHLSAVAGRGGMRGVWTGVAGASAKVNQIHFHLWCLIDTCRLRLWGYFYLARKTNHTHPYTHK